MGRGSRRRQLRGECCPGDWNPRDLGLLCTDPKGRVAKPLSFEASQDYVVVERQQSTVCGELSMGCGARSPYFQALLYHLLAG